MHSPVSDPWLCRACNSMLQSMHNMQNDTNSLSSGPDFKHTQALQHAVAWDAFSSI